MTVPYIIYADFEAYSQNINTCYPNPEESYTTVNASLKPCGFGYKVVCSVDARFTKETKIYRGENVSKTFIECLIEEEKEIREELENVEPLQMSSEDEIALNQAITCHICNLNFDE